MCFKILLMVQARSTAAGSALTAAIITADSEAYSPDAGYKSCSEPDLQRVNISEH